MSELTNGEKIGQYTKYLRLKLRISINEFSRKISVDPSFLTRLEKGLYQGVSIDVIEKLAVGFSMSIPEFLRKCKIASYEKTLPTIDHYLNEMYQLPPVAIADVKLFISFIQMKYAIQIKEMKKKHDAYWKKKKKLTK